MKYKVVYDTIMLFILLIFSVYIIYIGVRQIRREPFIVRGFSTRAAKVLPGVMIFSSNAIRYEFHMAFSLTTLCLLILFFLFLYIDNKKYYQLYIYNIEEEPLGELIEEFFQDKDIKVEIIDREAVFDLLYNEVRIYKSKSNKNNSDFINDFGKYIRPMKYKKFRVMGVFNTLLGVAFLFFFILIYIK